MASGFMKGEDEQQLAAKNWVIWQLTDSLLPTGGFAHSFGLEAAQQLNFVWSSLDLERYVSNTLEQTGAMMLPLVYGAWCAASLREESVLEWEAISRFTDILLTNHVSHRASVAQGNALLRVGTEAFPEFQPLRLLKRRILRQHKNFKRIVADEESQNANNCEPSLHPAGPTHWLEGQGREISALGTIRARVHAGQRFVSALQPHHAPVFGLLCGLAGITSQETQRMYLFYTLRDLLSAATRLNLIGPFQAAEMTARLGPSLGEEVLSRYKNRDPDQAHQPDPFLDVVQGLHDTLYTRIFNS